MKILVVDDEKLLVKGIKFNLENEGYTVDACYDGESRADGRLGRLQSHYPDLMMPGLDGLEACQKIRGFSTVPIIMLHSQERGRGQAAGLRVRRGRLCHKAFQHPGAQGAHPSALLGAPPCPRRALRLRAERGGLEIDTEKRTAREKRRPR